METFESQLTGGHPNSLGRTEEVVDLVLADRSLLPELYQCYFSDDDVVRLRTSSAMKRVAQREPEWLIDYIDRLLTDIASIDQASTQWTLAQLFDLLSDNMSTKQHQAAVKIMKRNLAEDDDWIVLNTTMQVLFEWSENDPKLRAWLLPQLDRLTGESRKSVAARATKLLIRGERQTAKPTDDKAR